MTALVNTSTGTVRARGPLTRWRTLDIVTAAVLGVALGVVFWGWDFASELLLPLFVVLAPLQGLVNGVWFLGGVVGALVVRRPGAALFVELLAAFTEMVLGNSWGVTTMLSGLLQGLGVELVMALFFYRRFGAATAAAAGALAGVAEVAGYEWWSWLVGYSWGWKFAYLGATAVSGAVLAGVLGWLLVRALAARGALDRFPAGTEFARGSAEHTSAARR
jgi:energy-coupling factor transport system substrate-specific component